MVNKVFNYSFLCFLGVLSVSICDGQSFISDKAVQAQALIVKSSPSSIEQAAAAEDLFNMVKGQNLNHVHSQTIHMISDLINTDNDGVTTWIAATLGEFRGRASFAAPRLVEILREVECRHVDASSAFRIRTALKRMGKDISGTKCTK